MARSDLYKLAKYAIKLHNILKGADEQQGLEGWVQAKITKASADISDVFHSIEYEMKFGNNTTDDLGKMKQGSDAPAEVPFESKKQYMDTLAQKLSERVMPGQNPQNYNPTPNAKPSRQEPPRQIAKADPNIELMGRGLIDYKGMQFKFAKGKPQSDRTRVVQAPMAAIGGRGIGAVPITLDMSTMSYYHTPGAKRPAGQNIMKQLSPGRRRESIEQDIEEKESPAGGPACWKGKKIGNPKTKIKDGKRVNNCVPAK